MFECYRAEAFSAWCQLGRNLAREQTTFLIKLVATPPPHKTLSCLLTQCFQLLQHAKQTSIDTMESFLKKAATQVSNSSVFLAIVTWNGSEL